LTLQQHLGYKKKPYNHQWFSVIGAVKDTIAKSLI
jgi:hypothetical protein